MDSRHIEQKSLFLENDTDNLPDSIFHVFAKVYSITLDSLKKHILYRCGVARSLNIRIAISHVYFNTLLLATKDLKCDVTLIKNFIYIPTLTCNSSIVLITCAHNVRMAKTTKSLNAIFALYEEGEVEHINGV